MSALTIYNKLSREQCPTENWTQCRVRGFTHLHFSSLGRVAECHRQTLLQVHNGYVNSIELLKGNKGMQPRRLDRLLPSNLLGIFEIDASTYSRRVGVVKILQATDVQAHTDKLTTGFNMSMKDFEG